jgi:hypothetical protein
MKSSEEIVKRAKKKGNITPSLGINHFAEVV